MADIDYRSYGLIPVEEPKASNDEKIDYRAYGLTPVENEAPILPEENKEGIVESVAKAGPRIYEDVTRGLHSAATEVPKLYESSKTEIPGLYELLMHHPKHAAAQAGAGITELGHGLLNLPHGIANYLSERLNLLPSKVTEAIPYQKDISNDINEVFGEPRYPGAELVRGIARNLPNIVGGAKALSILNPVKLTSKSIAKDVVRTEKAMKEKYSGEKGRYNKLTDKATGRGVDFTTY